MLHDLLNIYAAHWLPSSVEEIDVRDGTLIHDYEVVCIEFYQFGSDLKL